MIVGINTIILAFDISWRYVGLQLLLPAFALSIQSNLLFEG